MRGSLGQLFDRVIADPTSPDAPLLAQAVFAELERRARPTRVHRERLTKHAVLWWSLGFGPRGRAVLQRWRRDDPQNRELRLAETHFVVRTAPPQAAARFADVRDAPAAALAVIHLVLAGEPEAALAHARAQRWFATRRDLAHVLMFIGWALGLTASPDGERVLAMWKRHAAGDPEWLHHVLKAEAEIAMHACQYPRELQALRAAHALCIDHELGMQRVAVEVTLPCAFSHNADLAAARAVMKRWSAPALDYTPLDAGHDLARAEIELIAGRWDDSERAARRALAFFATADLAFHSCMAATFVALAAARSRFTRALAELRRIVHRVSVPFYRERYQLLERLAARGMLSVRDAVFTERTRFDRRPTTFAHVLYPRAESIAADIYWDRVQQRLWLRGRGPYSLDDHPIVARMLEAIVAADELTIPLATLFELVWRAPYQPLIHENKAHVTLHRLRTWLDAHHKGIGRAVLVRDGIVSIAEDIEVVVLEPPANVGEQADGASLHDRIVAALDEDSPLSARELQHRLGISRSALNQATRVLLDAGRIACSGQGRALLYSTMGPDSSRV
ncbi:MAG TPA: winged helix-turn-helix domain-containing protein [Kofleriaceae bacterium]